MANIDWHQLSKLPGREYVCGFCGKHVANDKGYGGKKGGYLHYVYICPSCNNPTFFDMHGKQTPGARFGSEVGGLSDKVKELYNQARGCMAVPAYTAAVLSCRKILMHVAVELGARTGQSFQDYVTFLATEGHIGRASKDWVDHIRTKSNEANHEIELMTKADAEQLLTFVEMLLRTLYEFPQKLKPPPEKRPEPPRATGAAPVPPAAS